MLNIQQRTRTHTGRKPRHAFLLLSATFSSSLLSHSIPPDNTALIIAELHRDNRLVESRAAAAEAVWENPSRLLQPVCRPCTPMCVLSFNPSCTGGNRQGTDDFFYITSTQLILRVSTTCLCHTILNHSCSTQCVICRIMAV